VLFQAEDREMQANTKPRVGQGQVQPARPAESLLAAIGWKGLFLVVWRATPPVVRLIALPYGLCVYRALLASCSDPQSLRTLHVQQYQSSRIFKLFRPRYHKVDEVLRSLLPDAPWAPTL